MKSFKVFIVEDDEFYGNLLQYHLSLNPDYEVSLFPTAKSCMENLHLQPDVVCVDFGLPDMSGDQLLKKIRGYNDQIPVVIISGQEEVAVAIGLLKNGASDYIIKDDNTKEILWKTIIQIRENANLRHEVESLKEQLETRYHFDSIIGQSKKMQQVFQLMDRAVKSTINVSITGETGTGKEVVAKAIHFNSNRKKHPFVAMNMAAIPKELLESELFGHEKGAFTGAQSKKTGQFELAHNGTLFLDEIGEMDLSLQSKILRAIQEREFTRVGGTTPVKFNARIITATHKNLVTEVNEGRFREDLFYRIMGLPIELPPLKSRGEDILLLAEQFVKMHCKENKVSAITLGKTAKEKLLSYHWPGNVRELKAAMDLACVMSDGKEVLAEDINLTSLKGMASVSSEGKTLKQYNADLITAYLEKYDNNVMEVARILDIGKSKIYSMIKSGEIASK